MRGKRGLNLVGLRFDKLEVLEFVASTQSGKIWLCLCDCGDTIHKLTTQLYRVKQGCFTGCRSCERKSRSDSKTKHGGAKYGKSKLYMVWKGMRSRCRDKGNTSYRYYGGKGICVRSEWKEFPAFRNWALANGYQEGLHIDRLDSTKDYGPDNCQFITAAENTRRMQSERVKV